jgi:glycosyltransferase involved in cell wall biosynthesis
MARDDVTSIDPAQRADMRTGLRILLSAYACEPHKGSEPGVGWHWAMALARAGHEVCVLTRANNQSAIESALTQQPVPNLQFVYYDLPAWSRWWKRRGHGVRLYYMLWQWGAYQLARHLCRERRFDVVHHITFGVFRHPTFMAFLDVPFVFGPVGGGETAPRALRRTFPPRGYVIDLVRDIANRAVRIDPLMTAVYRRAAATVCRTDETLRCIPEKYRNKCRVQLEIGTDGDSSTPACRAERKDGCFEVLYVGRLVYWKGVHLGLKAFAMFAATHGNARLTIIGNGPDERWLRRLAQRLGITDHVTWIPRLEHALVMRGYSRHDAFLFPSLHDSGGTAVLEALSRGLPVVCLNVGGPALLVDASCGFRVAAGQPDEVVAGLAHALGKLAQDPVLLQSMGEAASRRAREQFSWARQVARMERVYRAVGAGPAVDSYGVPAPLEERGAG